MRWLEEFSRLGLRFLPRTTWALQRESTLPVHAASVMVFAARASRSSSMGPWERVAVAEARLLSATRREGRKVLGIRLRRARRGLTNLRLSHLIGRRCVCFSCAVCGCTDRVDRLLPPEQCAQPWEGAQFSLGRAVTSVACRRACDHYVGPRLSPGKGNASCTVWMHHTASGACLGHMEAQVFDETAIAEVASEGTTVGLSLCAAPRRAPLAAPPPALPPGRRRSAIAQPALLVLHTVASYAVSSTVAARLARAHAELRGSGHVHRVALAAEVCVQQEECTEDQAPHARHRDSRAVSAIKAAVRRAAAAFTAQHGGPTAGDEHEVVQRVGREEVLHAFPLFLTNRSRDVRWGDRRRPTWLSNGCDLVGLAWLALFGRGLVSDRTMVWVLQHDVGWSGWLPAILSAAILDSQPFKPAAAVHQRRGPPDLVCLDIGRRNSSWTHASARNAAHAEAYPEQHSCLLPAARYSQRLLLHLLRELRAGLVSYCEVRAATTCTALPWCSVAELRGSGLLGPFSYFTTLNESALTRPKTAPPCGLRFDFVRCGGALARRRHGRRLCIRHWPAVSSSGIGHVISDL